MLPRIQAFSNARFVYSLVCAAGSRPLEEFADEPDYQFTLMGVSDGLDHFGSMFIGTLQNRRLLSPNFDKRDFVRL
jgi:hypothetical protein